MRADELAAITKAIGILADNKVEERAEVNKRVFLLQGKAAPSSASKTLGGHRGKASVSGAAATSKSLSFLQQRSSETRANTILGRVQERSSKTGANTFLSRGQLMLDARRDRALSTLLADAHRLDSLALSSLALQAAADPFQKVKGLIQGLIERLLKESAAEATKKGFCDTELAKAETERDYRFTESEDLSADLAKLESNEEALTLEIKQLIGDIKAEEKALKETTKDRNTDKLANMATIKIAQGGLKAVQDALLTLKTFYKEAAKAALIQATPMQMDSDKNLPGFDGAYSGKQSSSNAIFALLETIESDFDRTLRKTGAAEREAERDFVNYMQAAKESISSKTTKKTLDDQDLESTKITIKTKTGDMQTAVSLVDESLKQLVALAPMCVDSGMSYSERKKKREEEMAALERALCLLGGEAAEC